MLFPFYSNELLEDEKIISERFGLNISDKVSNGSFVFGLEKTALCVYKFGDSSKQKIYFDWIKQWRYHAKKQYAIRKEPLAKAIGLKGNTLTTVWDLTCGTGKDMLLLLCFGAKVVAFERNPVVSILLKDALQRALKDENLGRIINERLTLITQDPRDYSSAIIAPDTIYLDPMYPHIKKSAKSRKEMEMFKQIVGDDPDAAALLTFAKSHCDRVVVKRPLQGENLAPDIFHSYTGKSTRYDMFKK